ncbi:P27 family phage terminase small subunit [Bacillus thuringiensis]|uniref:P27 family phage terminase small subunit n=1 Tax=Bacillus thuringiensis TaxID=1428 RepID=UPI003F524A80
MKYKDIAEKYHVSIHTVKSWKRRQNWQQRGAIQIKGIHQYETNEARRLAIQTDLMNQLRENKTPDAQYTDLITDYMALWDIKNHLIADIEDRGVVVEWSNGKQTGKKKNESIGELNKTNGQMLKLLVELGLNATDREKDEDDEAPDV